MRLTHTMNQRLQISEIEAAAILTETRGFTSVKVPGTGFHYSLNPYRGCAFNCSYCLSGDTLIQMADGRAKPLRDVKVGDRIIGTERRGLFRHFVETTVLAHWSNRKPAYRLRLANGVEIVTSGDHRFLVSQRGWKYVTDAPGQRPHLTLNDRLTGLGTAAPTPDESEDYRRGYLAGVIRGDGHLKRHPDRRTPNSAGVVHSFRLVMQDQMAVERAAHYLEGFGVTPTWFGFAMHPNKPSIPSIRTSSKANFQAIERLIPELDTAEFRRGFLAGAIDAEGGNTGNGDTSVLRIHNSDQVYLDIIERSLTEQGFTYVYDKDHTPARKKVRTLRITGGLHQHVRLFQLVNPAVARKLKIAGGLVRAQHDLRVVDITPLGTEMEMFDITTGTEDFIANGVVVHNCYAPAFVFDEPLRETWGRWVTVKANAERLLRAAGRQGKLAGKNVYMSTVTDPYQPIERKLELTRACLQALLDYPPRLLTVQTRAPLVVRDIDLFSQMPGRVAVCMSITTDDEAVRRVFEPACAPLADRLQAIQTVRQAGIPTQASLAPLLPCDPERLADLLDPAVDWVVVSTFKDDGGFGRKTRQWAADLYRQHGYGHYLHEGDAHAARTIDVLRRRLGADRVRVGKDGFDQVCRALGVDEPVFEQARLFA